MSRFPTILLLALCWTTGGLVQAQEQPGPITGESKTVPTVDELTTKLQEIEKDASLADLARQALVTPYQEAIKHLGEAENMRALRDQFDASLRNGPAKVEQLNAELKALEDTKDERILSEGLDAQSGTKAVEAAQAREKVALSALQNELKARQEELTGIEKRAVTIGEQQVTAKAELDKATESLATLTANTAGQSEHPDRSVAGQKARLQAQVAKLKVELAMLEREDASGEIRTSAAEAARDLAQLQIEIAQTRITTLQQLATSLRKDTLEDAKDAAATIRSRIPDPPPGLRRLLDELELLITQTGKMGAQITTAEQLLRSRQEELDRIQSSFDNIKRQTELGDHESSLGRTLMEQLRGLPSPHEANQRAKQTAAELSRVRSAQFARQSASMNAPPGAAPEASGIPGNDGIPAELSAEVEAVVNMEQTIRDDLETGFKRLVQTLTDRLNIERKAISIREEFTAFAKEQLIFVRTSPMLGTETLRSLPASLESMYGPSRLAELGQQLAATPPTFWIVPGVLLGALLAFRPLLGRTLLQASRRTRRLATDRYRHTLVACGATLLLAAPAPLVSATLGTALLLQPGASSWSYALGDALLGIGFFLLKLSFLIAACRHKGLGETHLQWSPQTVTRLRHLAWWWLLVFVPCKLTTTIVFGEAHVPHLDDVGRFSGLVLALGLGTVIALIMHPSRGIAGVLHRKSPGSLIGRLRVFWFVLVIVVTIGITVLLTAGYLLAALHMLEQIVKSLTAIVVAFLAYGLVLRWFAIRERKLAVEQRLAEQKARREAEEARDASEQESTGAPDGEGPLAETPEEAGMDLAKVGEQTRNLLSFLTGVLLLWRLVAIWSEFKPVVKLLDGFPVLWTLSLADLGIIVLVIAALVATLRNLPGLLEAVVLQRFNVDSGTRTAITTLAKYAVIAAGLGFLFHTIGVDWSRFGWIAAALSVGLGFGLQEVVANFVCGIILLFERPVRVGDVVTIDGIDGTVTRIQIRATTITNWDRKDFIVPNKHFVTGTLMNWTRSNGLNRIVINVGVAYGSDVDRAREILAEEVASHPDLLEDPAPVVTFENFGDSSLDFVIRCYLPNLDRRVAVIDELHRAIYRRLGKEGIEIPFPQRDLHIRSGGTIAPA